MVSSVVAELLWNRMVVEKPHDKPEKGLLDGKTNILPDPGTEDPLHLLAQFKHAQEKEGETCEKKEDVLGHPLRDLAAVW